MKITTIALSLLAGIGAGCAIAPSAPLVSTSSLPDCFASNYDAQRNLFTMRNTARNLVNQQCVLAVGPGSRLSPGSYEVSLANGGGGGAGGTMQAGHGLGGGAGGGGAGAKETRVRVSLTEGVYKLTIGAGGPGGDACVMAPYYMGGGPGWAGSPSSIVRIATGELVAGIPGADTYARPSRSRHDRSSGLKDGHGGSGSGQTSGGHGGTSNSVTGVVILAESGQDASTGRIARTSAVSGKGGIAGGNEDPTSAGGGGGATSRADGGGGGGESPGHANRAPQRGSLGSGGGGGEGSIFECDAGASGGHGFIALRLL